MKTVRFITERDVDGKPVRYHEESMDADRDHYMMAFNMGWDVDRIVCRT